jgi:hypothetical protein
MGAVIYFCFITDVGDADPTLSAAEDAEGGGRKSVFASLCLVK